MTSSSLISLVQYEWN